MAEWKARGYVLDSDEEEDSQDSLPADSAAPQEPFHNIDDIEGTRSHQDGKEFLGNGGADESESGSGGHPSSGRATGRGDSNTAASRAAGYGGQDVQVESLSSTGGDENKTENAVTMQAFEDIDELQQERYEIAQEVRVVSNRIHGAREKGKQCQNSPSIQDRDLLADIDISSPSSNPSLEFLPASPLANTRISMIDGQSSEADNHIADLDNPNTNDEKVSSDMRETLPVNRNMDPIRTTRNLRHRNPIQLHPYAIEGEKYRQILHARGVKPLRIAQMEAEAAVASTEDSQSADFTAEGSQLIEIDDEPENLNSSSPLRNQHTLDASDERDDRLNDIFVFGEDDLPDMNALLSHTHQFSRNGYKRRKTIPAAFKPPPKLFTKSHTPLQQGQVSPLQDNDDVMLDVPPSPPRSGCQTPLDAAHPTIPKFRLPRTSSPSALPTPATSSEPQRRTFLDVSDRETSDHQSNRSARTADSDNGTVSDNLEFEDEASHQLQRAQRKIRGVLPASWLKIDLKTQGKKPSVDRKAPTSASPEKSSKYRGVARPITWKRSRSPELRPMQNKPNLLSESEASDSANTNVSSRRRPQPNISLSRGVDEDFLTGRWGEAAEDDHIDAMLPVAGRMSSHPRKRGKRQTKIADFGSRSKSIAQNFSEKSHGQGTPRPELTARYDKGYKRKSKFRPPRLSILDAPSMKIPSHDSMPRFLKIASRTVRSRYDKGRHSPSRKYIQLATRGDNHDANESLRNWREATVVPPVRYNANTARNRQPLYPRSDNGLFPLMSSGSKETGNQPGGPASKKTFVKPRVQSARPRKLQSSLDRLVHRQRRGGPDAKHTSKAVYPLQSDGKPKKRGQIVSSLQASTESRPAMLESLPNQDGAAFRRDLSRVNRFDNESGLPSVLLKRFFEEDDRQVLDATKSRMDGAKGRERVLKTNAASGMLLPHRPRKRRPQRVDVSAFWCGKSSATIVLDDLPEVMHSACLSDAGERGTILGLGGFGTRYSDTFDVTPLPLGTCFHANTILGSQMLARSLKLEGSNSIDSSRGFTIVRYDDQTFRWGPWNDTVSSGLGKIFHTISLAMSGASEPRQQVVSTLEQIVNWQKKIVAYFSENLSFLDPIDRISYVQKCNGLVATLLSEIKEQSKIVGAGSAQKPEDLRLELYTQVSTLSLILANQLRQISKHELISQSLQNEVRLLVQKAAQQGLAIAMKGGYESFATCLSELKHPNAVDRIIREDQHSIEAFVVVQHILGQDSESKVNVWETFQKDILTTSPNGVLDTRVVEQHWKWLFTLLPFFEFDAQGVLESGKRFNLFLDNWNLVKKLISPVLEISLANSIGQPPSFNTYCRALFARCLHLINGWGWRRCESIIGTLFDFFARNNLAHLRNEESRGSPLFLEQLAKNATLRVEPEDRCFHILLKIIGSGLCHMRQLYPEKKIRDIVWRLMPNHGRFHPKEEAIRKEDLDALRNHHDLLCTLYWAAPSGFRPRLTVIRNLVHLETSHREACHINVRAWFNLVKFQLSTDESTNSLEPFLDWHEDLLIQILRQHDLARTEAEDQVRSVQHAGGPTISKELLESTIARNRRQVEAILCDALVSLKLAVDAAPTQKAAAILLSVSLTRVFDLFDARRPQATTNIVQALDVLSAYTNESSVRHQQSGPRSDNDDSQDYGDWSVFDTDEVSKLPPPEDAALPLQKFQEPLRQLLSNCFGADVVPEDSLLLKLVDVWISIAQISVRHGTKSWSDYLGRFGNDSWSSLRDTEQARKYNAYFLAMLIEKERGVYQDHKGDILTSWIGSLVEREALLKFQHRFTNALLNTGSETPILENLPIWDDKITGRFQITAIEFSERRLSLISSVLSNMRLSLENAIFDPTINSAELRHEYKDLLKHLMATMKDNYQALGQGSNLRGAYVDFVHCIVEFLQQHASAICPIDRFFTDNGAFPLPATDPTYVVGQLKNYGLRIQDPRTPKQLVVFLQSVSERAAVDGQQPYLAGQLHAAMSNALEEGVFSRPTLRSFLVEAIIPAYIKLAFSTPTGWILILPFLQALRNIFAELFKDLDGTRIGSIVAVSSIITTFIGSVWHSLESLTDQSAPFHEASVLKTLTACYSAVTAALPLLDYLVRLSGPTQRAVHGIESLKAFASFSSALLHGQDDTSRWGITKTQDITAHETYADIREFASQELRETLRKNWVLHDEQYFVVRGSSRREVMVDIGLYEEEKAQLQKTYHDFFDCLEDMPALCDDERRSLAIRSKTVPGLDGLVF